MHSTMLLLSCFTRSSSCHISKARVSPHVFFRYHHSRLGMDVASWWWRENIRLGFPYSNIRKNITKHKHSQVPPLPSIDTRIPSYSLLNFFAIPPSGADDHYTVNRRNYHEATNSILHIPRSISPRVSAIVSGLWTCSM